jgi:hypothetical protein
MIPKWAKDLYHAARVRAAKKGVPFTLTQTDLAALVDAANGCCALSKIPFEFDKQGHRVKRPFAPSMDRIDHRQGYIPGNVRFVCVAANVAMNVWGESALRRLAEGICGLTDRLGVWSPAIPGMGTAVRKTADGRCSYQARVMVDGRYLSFGSYRNRMDAFARVKEIKQAIASGVDPYSLLSKGSKAKISSLRLHTDFGTTQ